MAEGGDAPFQTNADVVAEAFTLLATSLKEQLQPFTSEMAVEVQGEIETLYGPHLAKFWVVDGSADVVDAGELAHIEAMTTDYRVTAYEYGIRPHEIWAHNIALKFDKDGEILYRRMVHHPGTKGKDLAPTLETEMTALAETGWDDALSTIIAAWMADL